MGVIQCAKYESAVASRTKGLLGEHVEEAPRPRVHRPAVRDEPGDEVGVVGVERLAILGRREQEPRLFEQLARARHPVREAARVEAEDRRGGGVVESCAALRGAVGRVLGVDGAAGEDVGTADEVAVEVPQEHQHLEATLGTVARDDDGRGGAWRCRGIHRENLARQSSSLVVAGYPARTMPTIAEGAVSNEMGAPW